MNYNSCHRIKLSVWVQRNLESRRGKCYLLEFLDLWKMNPNIHHIPMLLLIAFTHIPLHNTTDTMLWGTDRCDQSDTSITTLRIIKSHEISCNILHSSFVAWLATITAAMTLTQEKVVVYWSNEIWLLHTVTKSLTVCITYVYYYLHIYKMQKSMQKQKTVEKILAS